MKQDIEAILRHELHLLRAKSLLGGGLELPEFKKFELIVRVHKEFVGKSKEEDDSGGVEDASVEDLLNGIETKTPKPV